MLSNSTFKFLFNFNKENKINLDDIHCLTLDLRKFHGTKKEVVETLSKTMSFIVRVNKNSKSFKYKL